MKYCLACITPPCYELTDACSVTPISSYHKKKSYLYLDTDVSKAISLWSRVFLI